jgi:hypothetical protein
MHQFLTGRAAKAQITAVARVQLSGNVTGLGLSSTDAASDQLRQQPAR